MFTLSHLEERIAGMDEGTDNPFGPIWVQMLEKMFQFTNKFTIHYCCKIHKKYQVLLLKKENYFAAAVLQVKV
jgi:hypothetical protein